MDRAARTTIADARSGPEQASGRSAWAFLGVGTALILLYRFQPPALGVPLWAWRFAIAMIINSSAAVAIVVGIRRWRPKPTIAWGLLAVSQAVYALADFAFYWEIYVDHSTSYPSLADVFYLGRVPFIVVGLALILLRRDPRGQSSMIDSLIAATSVGLVSWIFLMEPSTASARGLLFRLVAIAYPITDLIMVVLVTSLLVGGGRRSPSFTILAGGLGLLVANDALYEWRNLHGYLFSSGSINEIGWLVYYVTAGAFALHPSVRDLSTPAPPTPWRRSMGRTWLVGAAIFVAPVTLVSESLLGRPVNALAIGTAGLVIAGLVVIRFLGVLGRLERSEARFRRLASNAPIGIAESSTVGHIEYVNTRLTEISGRDVDDMLGRGWVDGLHPDERESVLAMIDEAARERRQLVTRFRYRRPDGEVRHLQLTASPTSDSPGGGAVSTIEDVTQEVLDREQLNHLAFHDSLTGLPNRALFMDRLQQELARGARAGSHVAVLFLDVDDFKFINDSLGHEVGDALLTELGRRFSEFVRADETAARFGGDEFSFIIRGNHEGEDAVAAGKRVLSLFDAPIRCGDEELRVTASMGIALSSGAVDAATLVRDADTAMYQAKSDGRNRYVVFGDELHQRLVDRLRATEELRQAIDRSEFELYYQPIVDLATGRPVSAEALVRWNHPSRGVLGPAAFISTAEQSGLIVPLGRWIVTNAVAQLARWDASESGPRLRGVAVNVSARQLEDSELPDVIAAAIRRYGIEPARLCVEITESVMMADGATTRRSVEALRQLGVSVALDDFGTGYSSLAYLHTLPVSTLKIDRSFVERLGAADEDSTAVVGAITEMSHAMGLRVVAEGASTAELARAVAELGCDFGQGYHWARPITADALAPWWRRTERRAYDHGTSP